jgi:hypothetical protein|tara:strand:+ start:176 stop:430 length:255 start_codon:yes stop_codon:yes gene_type:complete
MSEKETTILRQKPSSKTLTIKRPKINIPEGKLFVEQVDEEKEEWQPINFTDIQISEYDYSKQDELVDEQMWKDGSELYDWWENE